jgi:CheY-like chemotaxis protein
MARVGRFNLLLSDIGLPDGTGYDLIRQVRQFSDMPAIALSGFGMEEDVSDCREAGFSDHLTKPVNFQRLAMMIQRISFPEGTSTSRGTQA